MLSTAKWCHVFDVGLQLVKCADVMRQLPLLGGLSVEIVGVSETLGNLSEPTASHDTNITQLQCQEEVAAVVIYVMELQPPLFMA